MTEGLNHLYYVLLDFLTHNYGNTVVEGVIGRIIDVSRLPAGHVKLPEGFQQGGCGVLSGNHDHNRGHNHDHDLDIRNPDQELPDS